MCIIIYSEVKPELELLQDCEFSNPDGGGMAWRENGKVRFQKGIDSAAMMKIIEATEPPYALHFRISTVGGKPKTLTHPFPIGGNLELAGSTDTVLFHNGHWRDWEDRLWQSLDKHVLPDGTWSDSRAMAYLAQYYGLNWFNLIDDQKVLLFGHETYRSFGKWTLHQSNPETKAAEIWLSHPLVSIIETTTTYYGNSVYNNGDWKEKPVSRKERRRLKRLGYKLGGKSLIGGTTRHEYNAATTSLIDDVPPSLEDDDTEPDETWSQEDTEAWIRNNYDRATCYAD